MSQTPVPEADPALIEQAALWMARLWADDASPEDHSACARWRGESPAHEHAWQCLQQVSGKFATLPPGRSHGQLLIRARQRPLPRRQLLQWGALGIGLAATGYGLDAPQRWRGALAGQRTAVGEIRDLRLPDGSQLVLNTDTALDLDYSPSQRHIRLQRGEVWIETGRETPRRPFTLDTRHGRLLALGTRFTVRHERAWSHLAVIEGAVRVSLRDSTEQRVVNAGQQLTFDRRVLGAPHPLDAQSLHWHEGQLVVERMRLAELLAELARYRHGWLGCADEVAELRVSGVFSLRDTERALDSLEQSLPVKARRLTRLWVRLEAAPGQPHK